MKPSYHPFRGSRSTPTSIPAGCLGDVVELEQVVHGLDHGLDEEPHDALLQPVEEAARARRLRADELVQEVFDRDPSSLRVSALSSSNSSSWACT